MAVLKDFNSTHLIPLLLQELMRYTILNQFYDIGVTLFDS